MGGAERRFSLEARLTLRLTAVFVGALILGLGVFLFESFDEYRRDFGGRMAAAADIVTRSIEEVGGTWRIDLMPEEQEALNGIPGFRFAVRRVSDGAVLQGSDPVLASTFDIYDASSVRRERNAFRDLLPSPAGPVEILMTRGEVEVVDIIEWLGELSTETLPAFLLVAGGGLLVMAIGIRRDLKPVHKIAHDAERIGPSDTARRLDEACVPAEILPLVRAVNGALGRLDRAVESQRQFTADAAHELRTPVAVLRARVDALPSGETAASLKADLARLSRLVDQLLTVSLLDGSTLDIESRVDVGAVVRAVV